MNFERWQKFSKGQQIGAIAAEITRAQVWHKKDKERTLSAIERALELIDLTINDNRWQGLRAMLFWLRNELADFYIGNKNLDFKNLILAL